MLHKLSHYFQSVLKTNQIELQYNGQNTVCQCKRCKKTWILLVQEGGKFRRGFWKCPDGCCSR